MKLYLVRTVCDARLYETWLVPVPDEVDTTDFDINDWLDGGRDIECIAEFADDERNHYLRSVAPTDEEEANAEREAGRR